MAVPVVIDGYNLLYARGETPSPASRDRLARDVVRWALRRKRRAVLVFDGWAGGRRDEHEEARGPVTVSFTRYGERADAWIVRWVATRPEAVVVTSDRAVRQAAERRGAAVLDSDRFAERLEAARDPDGDEPDPVEPPRGRGAGRQAAWLRGL
ncbi:MAG: NYN domain-containing protein [Candidatus Rokubacteria bacterium]|nr:NYN domain-containing protein [Candidatus Rokubacteria bacterium]